MVELIGDGVDEGFSSKVVAGAADVSTPSRRRSKTVPYVRISDEQVDVMSSSRSSL